MPSSIESLYLRLPTVLQHAAVTLEGFRIGRRRYGGKYSAVLREVAGRDRITKSELQTFQIRRLREFLSCASRTEYWKSQFECFGVDSNAGDPFGELAKLPVLSKETTKTNVSTIRNQNLPDGSLLWRHTSGTTGSGLVFPETRESEWFTWAHWWRYRERHGVTPQMWCGYFGGRSLVSIDATEPPFSRINLAGRQVMFSGYHLREDTAQSYFQTLREYKVSWIHGYPSLLTLLAQFSRDMGRAGKLPNLRVITTGAENLADWQREAIARAFGVPVFQHYGQAEAVANASECEYGRLHVDEDFSFVEFVDHPDLLDCKRIVGTNWLNPAFPLLRYDAGDLATVDSSNCACGRIGRVLSSIDGRDEDYILLPSGVRIGRLDHVFKDMVNVREAQFEQLEVDRVQLRVVRCREYAESDERILYHELRQRLGSRIEIDVEYVEQIPRGSNGKLRLVVSRLTKGRTELEDINDGSSV